MPLINCLELLKIPHDRKSIEARISALENGKQKLTRVEAEAIVKNEFINEEYQQINNDLNKIKASIKLPAAKVGKIPMPDLKESTKKYNETLLEAKKMIQALQEKLIRLFNRMNQNPKNKGIKKQYNKVKHQLATEMQKMPLPF